MTNPSKNKCCETCSRKGYCSDLWCPCHQPQKESGEKKHCAGCLKCTLRSDVHTGEQCVAKYNCDCHFSDEDAKADAAMIDEELAPNDKATHKDGSDAPTKTPIIPSPTPYEKWGRECRAAINLTCDDAEAQKKLEEIIELQWICLRPVISSLLQREREVAYEKGKDSMEVVFDRPSYEKGAAQERKRILEIVEGMRNDLEKKIRSENVGELTTKNEPHNSWITGRFQALTDLRAKLEDDLEK